MKECLIKPCTFISLLAMGVLLSCNPDSKRSDETWPVELATMDSFLKKHLALYEKGDVEGFSKMYSEDAVVLAPDKKFLGRTQIFDWYTGAYKTGITGFNGQVDSVWTDNNLMGLDGTWSMSGDNGINEFHGKFIFLLRKEGDQWKVFRDIFNVEPVAETSSQ